MFETWHEKHAPKKLSEVIDNRDRIVVFHKWLSGFDADNSEKICLLSGPSGCGKTLLTKLVTQRASVSPMVFDGADLKVRNETSGKRKLDDVMAATTNRTISWMRKQERACIIIENIEDSDQALLSKMMERSRVPLIGTCGCGYEPKLKTLKASSKCLHVVLTTPKEDKLVKHLRQVCSRENLEISEKGLKEIVCSNDGDIRKCLNELEFSRKNIHTTETVAEPVRNISSFEATKRIFQMSASTSMSELIAFTGAAELVDLFVHENYLTNATSVGQASNAAEYLSQSDVMNRSLPQEMCVCLSTISPARICQTRRPSIRAFPALLGRMSTLRKKNGMTIGLRNELTRGRNVDDGTSTVWDILPQLRRNVVEILKRTIGEKDRAIVKRGNMEVVALMRNLQLTKEEMVDMFELEPKASSKNSYAQLPAPTKSNLTRAWK